MNKVLWVKINCLLIPLWNFGKKQCGSLNRDSNEPQPR